MTEGFSAPATADSVKPADLNGHLLIISPIDYIAKMNTSMGETDAIEVNIIDLDSNEEYNSVLFFNVALINALKPNIGNKVLGRIGQGVAKPGKSAPWILHSAVEDAAAVAKANAYLAGAAQAPAATATNTADLLRTQLGATQAPF